ncbi:MAG: type II toxin-antitoxin system VapC family toxin [Candidatus Eremiobacteraeota bacterium]|nr:type II toxin-antitoxin system VapC family toxin [Candidatus Eremiobacteraeota bacterium]
MRLLIDTHVFLWLESEPERLRRATGRIVEDPENELYLSAVSGWEIAIKHAIGKLRLPVDPPVYVPTRLARGGFQELDLTMQHALAVCGLPLYHDDPFDRLLVAQAQVEGLTLVTVDEQMTKYPIHVLKG